MIGKTYTSRSVTGHELRRTVLDLRTIGTTQYANVRDHGTGGECLLPVASLGDVSDDGCSPSNSKSSAPRVSAHNAKLLAAGGALVRVRFPPDAAKRLDRLAADRGISRTAVLVDLVRQA